MKKFLLLLPLLLLTQHANAATPAFVQQQFDVTCGGSNCSSKAITLPSPVGVGHFIGVVANYCNNGGCTLTGPVSVTVTDNHLATYSCPVDDDNSTASHAIICYAYNVAGGSTVVTLTASPAPMNYLRVWVVEFSGLARSFDPLDQTRATDVFGSGSTTVATTTGATTMTGELMLAMSDNFFATVTSVSAPAVMLQANTGGEIVPQAAYLITGPAGIATMTFNLSGAVITRHYVLAMFCPPTQCGMPAGNGFKQKVQEY